LTPGVYKHFIIYGRIRSKRIVSPKASTASKEPFILMYRKGDMSSAEGMVPSAVVRRREPLSRSQL